MRIYYFFTRPYKNYCKEKISQCGSVSFNFKSLKELYKGLNSNNLIVRFEAKMVLDFYKISKRQDKKILWHGLYLDKMKKFYSDWDLKEFNGGSEKLSKASDNPDWFNKSFMSKTVGLFRKESSKFKVAKDIQKNKTNGKNTLFLLPWVYK